MITGKGVVIVGNLNDDEFMIAVSCRVYNQHQFTIPVEWEEMKGHVDAYTAPKTVKKVTILRCACGEEKKR